MPILLLPPYLLESIAERGSPHAAECARATLRRDAQLQTSSRESPQQRSAEPPPSTPGKPNRLIHDAANTEQLPGRQLRAEGEPATGDAAGDEAYDGLGVTWQLFAEVYRRDAPDGRGMPLIGTVHYGSNYANAFWDGRQMVFGDGDGELFNRFTASIDVIAHELTHAVIEFTAGLRYADQSGALNESICDVFGSVAKQRRIGHSADQADWLIGAELFTDKVNGQALRSMAAPGTAYDDPVLGKDRQVDHWDKFVTTTEDNGGVHINSGIPNKAFHLAALALGGNAWDRAGAIWYAALTGDQIAADCDFATFAALTIRAASAQGADQEKAVRQAWAGVGVVPVGNTEKSPPPPPRSPAPDAEPTTDPRFYLGRSGGFTGIGRSRELRPGDLAEPDATSWRRLLRGPDLTAWSQTPEPAADRYLYRVVCPAMTLDVQLPEPGLPAEVRELFQRTLDR